MAVSLTQNEVGFSTASQISQAYTLTAGYSPATLLVAAVANAGSMTVNTITDSKSNTWTRIETFGSVGAPITTMSLWTCTVSTSLAAGDVLTLAMSSATTYTLVLATASGVSATVDNHSNGQGTGTAYSVTPVVLTAGGLEIVAVGSGYSALATDLVYASATILAGTNQPTARSIGLAYKTAAGGSESASCSAANSHPWSEVMIALSPAAAVSNVTFGKHVTIGV